MRRVGPRLVLLAGLAVAGSAQLAPPAREIPLYAGVAPGSENWTYPERAAGTPDRPQAQNIVAARVALLPGGAISRRGDGHDCRARRWLPNADDVLRRRGCRQTAQSDGCGRVCAEVPHHLHRRGCSRRQPDASNAFEPLWIDVRRGINQPRFHVQALGKLHQAVAVGAVLRAHNQY